VNQEFSIIKQGQFQKPPSSEIHWPLVREYLVDQMQLPADLVDKSHEDGLIYSDNRRNCVFLRDQDSGAFIINTKGQPFTRTLGDDGNPVVLPGSDKAVYITDSPMEALSLKTMHPESTILAIGELPDKNKLKPYLEDRARIFLAQGKDKEGTENARFLPEKCTQAERLLPARGQTWNEEMRLQRIEREQAQEQILSVESINKTNSVKIGNEILRPVASGQIRMF
jgi:hypothetical protein